MSDVEPFRQHYPAWALLPLSTSLKTRRPTRSLSICRGSKRKTFEVKVGHGNLTIKGEKQDEKVHKKADYCLRERLFGSFERSFRISDGVDTDKIEANFQKGVLTVTLSKKPKAQRPAKKTAPKALEVREPTR